MNQVHIPETDDDGDDEEENNGEIQHSARPASRRSLLHSLFGIMVYNDYVCTSSESKNMMLPNDSCCRSWWNVAKRATSGLR